MTLSKPGAAALNAGQVATGIVPALLNELGSLLETYLATGRAGSIDTLNIPMTPAELKSLEDELGKGEVSISIDAGGLSQISETAHAGVWWVHHKDETGRLVCRLIEVTNMPDFVCSSRHEIENSARRLSGFTTDLLT